MLERQRLNGLQDRSLELGRARRDHSTPTKDGDISERARLYKGLVQGAVVASMAYEGMLDGRGTPEMIEEQTAQIRTVRREAVLAGFNLGAFDMVVKDTITLLKRKEAEKEEDWKLINGEFPGQFDQEEFEHQAFRGESPVHRADAGFPAPEGRRRGW